MSDSAGSQNKKGAQDGSTFTLYRPTTGMQVSLVMRLEISLCI